MSANTARECPTTEQLFALLTPEIDDRRRADVEAHLLHCESCRERFRVIRHGSETRIFGQQISSVAEPAVSDEIPAELQDHPRYRVTRFLGGGGMGMVFKAEHRLLERPVVLKVIRPNLVDREDLIERFRRESRLAAKLSHPNIVTVYEAEQIGTMQVLVMEYIDGTNVARLAHGSNNLPVAQACEIARQVAIGLQHIHERGLVHRDIKPSNLLVTPDGVVKILDMGLAILKAEHAAGSTLTGEMQMLGTIDYAAPEQWGDSRAVDHRADIYSLGCTLYHLLTGGAPFSDTKYSTVMKKMWAHGYAPIPPIADVRPDVPKPLTDILDRMLAKDRDLRFASAAEVAEALTPFAAESPMRGVALGLLDTVTSMRNSSTQIGLIGRVRSSVKISIDPGLPGRGGRRRWLAWSAGAAAMAAAFAFASYHWKWFDGRLSDDNSIRVGILHSLSGTMMQSEAGVVDATLLAIREINESGGLLGRRVEPVVVDGQSDPVVFASEAEKLIDHKKVRVIFGCWTSASRKSVRPVMEKRDHLLVYPVQFEGLELSRNIIYLGAAPNQQILPAVRWAFTELGKRFYLVGSDYVFPRTAHAIMADEIKRLGGEIVGESYIPLGASDVADAVHRIVEARPAVILNTINGDANTVFFRALRAAGVRPETIPTVSFSMAEPELAALRAGNVAGDYAAWNYFQSVDRPQNRAFIEKFKAAYGPNRVLSDPMEAAYCGVHLWAMAVRQSGVDDPRTVRLAMLGQTFEGPGAAIRIDPETQYAWKVARIGRIGATGQFEIVNSSSTPIKPQPFPPSRTETQWNAFLADLQKQWSGKWQSDRNGSAR